jgi:hypothetical protein
MAVQNVIDIVKITGETITGLVKDLTGMRVVEKVSGGLKGVSDTSAKLVKKVPIAGGVVMYVFKQGGKGILVLGKRVDKSIKILGDLTNTVVGTAQDTIVWTLVTTRGTVRRVGYSLSSLNGKDRRKKKTRRRGRRRGRKSTRR